MKFARALRFFFTVVLRHPAVLAIIDTELWEGVVEAVRERFGELGDGRLWEIIQQIWSQRQEILDFILLIIEAISAFTSPGVVLMTGNPGGSVEELSEEEFGKLCVALGAPEQPEAEPTTAA